MIDLLNIALTVLFSQNILLMMVLGVGVSTQAFVRPKHSLSMGLGLTGVLVILTPLSRLVDEGLKAGGLAHLTLLAFTLLAFGGSALLGWGLRHTLPRLWEMMRPGLEGLPQNAGILGAMLVASHQGYSLVEALVFGLFGGLGLVVALVSLVGVSQNVTSFGCPRAFRGLPMMLITAGFLSLSLMGFCGLYLTG